MHRESKLLARWLAVAAAVMFASSGAAAGGLSYTTVFKTHLVYGTTPQALWQYMVSHPIPDPDDGPALANILHDHKLAVTTTSSRGGCKVKQLNFTWHFVITLPKAVDYARMSSATKRMWQEFLAKAKWHELHRRSIFLGCGASFVPRAQKMTAPTCPALAARVRRYVDDEYAFCMQKQRAFGVADGPSVARLGLLRVGRGY